MTPLAPSIIRRSVCAGLFGLSVISVLGAACSPSALPQGTCTAPRATPGDVYFGTMTTTLDGVEVRESARVRLSATSGAVEVSIAPEGGSESSCLLSAVSGRIGQGSICNDPNDPSGATVLAMDDGSIQVTGPHLDLKASGHVMGLPWVESGGSLKGTWTFSGEKVPPPPPQPYGGPTVLRMALQHQAASGFLDGPFPSVNRVKDNKVQIADFPAATMAPKPFPAIAAHLLFGALSNIVGTLRDMSASRKGFGLTSGVFFQATGALTDIDGTKVYSGLNDPYVLVPVLPTGKLGDAHPIHVHFREKGGSLAVPDMLGLLPVQGRPLREDTLYLAFVRTGLSTQDAAGLKPAPEMALLRGAMDGAPGNDVAAYKQALVALAASGGPSLDSIAALTVFKTGKPTAELLQLRAQTKETMKFLAPFQTREVEDEFCVYESKASVPVYQKGTPPYQLGDGILPSAIDFLAKVFNATTRGGQMVFTAQPQTRAESRVVLTLPRKIKHPAKGWPLTVFIRAGAGMDSDESPLVDRGPTLALHADPIDGCMPLIGHEPRHKAGEHCGEGPALEFARAGMAGVTIDGPQTGTRLAPGAGLFGQLVKPCAIPNYTGEDWAMFDVCNPVAITDNIRESALETALVPDLLLGAPLEVAVGDRDVCGLKGARIDPARLALMGHSMGATVAPLALALERRFHAVVLSGANASYIENIVAKQRPDPLAPSLEDMLNLQSCTTEFDLLPNLFQWAEEPSEPAVYEPLVFSGDRGKPNPPDLLMVQGIGDHYVPSPVANVSAVGLHLDLVGPEYDAVDPRKCVDNPGADVPPYYCPDGVTRRFPLSPVSRLLPLAGGSVLPVAPAGGVANNRMGATGAVVQYRRDLVCRDDGHEVAYDIAQARWQYRCFLRSFATNGIGRVYPPPPANPTDDTLDISAACPP